MKTAKHSSWWADFASDARPIFNLIPAKETHQLVRYIIEKFNLKRGSTYFDCCCGIGRIAIPLAARGIRVTGIDASPEYLEELRTTIRKRNLPITCVQCDMRRFKYERKFDVVGNLGTSFGFFERDSDNVRVLRNLYRALKPGGGFILTVTNRDWLLKYFVSTGWDELGPVRLLHKRWFDYERSAIIADWHFLKGDQESIHRSYVRMYSYHEIRMVLESIGFENVEAYGSLKEEPLSADSRTMIVVATRPRK